MKPGRSSDGERALAVFIDFENLGLGFQNRRDRFDIHKVLERLVEKGKIVAKKAYADWSRFSSYTTALHEAAIELVEIPRRGVSGKNSADIRLVVDAIDLAYSKDHIDTFVIVSGDSDFSPLVSKLKELGKHVIGLGLADATSDLLRDNCDEFIYYEDLDRAPIIPVSMNENIPERKRKAFSLLLESLLALRRENKEIIYSSMIKETMKRKKPSFNEEYYGYRTFSEFLEDAQKLGLLELEKHKPSGMYIVTRFGLEMQKTADKPATASQEVDHRSSLGATTGPSTVSSSERARVGEVRSGDEEPTVSSESVRRAGSVPRTSPATATSLRPKHAELQEPLTPLDYPLGRALIDEVAWEDELDEVPSYGATPLLIPKKTATGGPNDTNRPATGRSASGSPQPAPSVAKTVTTAKAATPRSVPTGSRSATTGSASLPSSPAASNISSTSSATPQPAARGGQKRGQGAAAGSRRTSNKAVAAGSTKGKTSNSTADRPHTPSPPSTAMSKGAETRAGAVTSPPTEPTSASSSSFVSAGLESHEEAEFRAGLED